MAGPADLFLIQPKGHLNPIIMARLNPAYFHRLVNVRAVLLLPVVAAPRRARPQHVCGAFLLQRTRTAGFTLRLCEQPANQGEASRVRVGRLLLGPLRPSCGGMAGPACPQEEASCCDIGAATVTRILACNGKGRATGAFPCPAGTVGAAPAQRKRLPDDDQANRFTASAVNIYRATFNLFRGGNNQRRGADDTSHYERLSPSCLFTGPRTGKRNLRARLSCCKREPRVFTAAMITPVRPTLDEGLSHRRQPSRASFSRPY